METTGYLAEMGDAIPNINYCNQALQFEKSLSTQFLTLGEYLFNIRENNLFSPQWESFNEFCMEFRSLSQASISKLANIYKKFVLDYGIPTEKLVATGGWASLAEIIPLIQDQESAEEWIEKATVLSRDDLRKEITEKKTGKDMSQCEHENNYTVRICRECHDREKIGDSMME